MQDKTNAKKSIFAQAIDDVNNEKKDSKFQDKNKFDEQTELLVDARTPVNTNANSI